LLVEYRPVLLLITLIWVVEVVNVVLGHTLEEWGILPRHLGGLIGIPLAPFIHGGIWHAVSNTIPLLILGFLVVSGDRRLFWETTVNVTILGGLLVWLFARESYHVGASGLVFGFFGVIMGRAYFERSVIAIIIALVTAITYGGLIWGVLPLRSGISFESHLFGLIAGIIVVWLERRFGQPNPPE
jgi:membrane associated rhomboid family serine protease